MSIEKSFQEELLRTFELHSKKNGKGKSIDALLNYGIAKKLIDPKHIKRYSVVNAFYREIDKGSKKTVAFKLVAKEFNLGEGSVQNIIKNYSLEYREKAN